MLNSTRTHNHQFQPASKPQRGLPATARHLKAEELDHIHELDSEIHGQRMKVHAMVKDAEIRGPNLAARARGNRHWQHSERRAKASDRMSILAHEELVALEQQRISLLQSTHQKTTETHRQNRNRRSIESRRRQSVLQTGIENQTTDIRHL